MLKKENIIEKIKECMKEINDEKKFNIQLKNSLSNCHFVGVYSIWINDTMRCFITEKDINDLSIFDNNKPHLNNERFLIHNHRYDITSIPIEGYQENVLFEEMLPDFNMQESNDDTIEIYKKYKFYSAILSSNKEIGYKYQGDVLLKRIKYEINKPWLMKTHEIHRICWKGPIIALIIEHRNPTYINSDPTDAYLINTATDLPCDETQLYKPINITDFNRLLHRLNLQLTNYLLKLNNNLN